MRLVLISNLVSSIASNILKIINKKGEEKMLRNAAYIIIIVILIIGWISVANDPASPNLSGNQPTKITPNFVKPNLTDFVSVKELGLTWDCNDSNYLDKQIITASGENMLFVCNSFGDPMVKFCEEGINVSNIGMHDSCK